MTVILRNQAVASRRQSAVYVDSLVDGSPLYAMTDISTWLVVRLGGSSWVAASGTAVNTGYDGHWVYTWAQAETDVDANEIEIRAIDPTGTGGAHPYFAQTLVDIDQATSSILAAVAAVQAAVDPAVIAAAVLDAARSGHIVLGSVGEGVALATSLLQGNFYIDNVTNTANGPTAQRLRCWLSAAAMAGVTPGGSGQGEFATFIVATTYAGPSKIVTHQVTQQ